MRILLSGATGLVGQAWQQSAAHQGHEVLRLRHGQSDNPEDITWNPESGIDAPERLEGLDAVIHLAGENIADGRWTAAKKKRIRDSRVQGTQLLAATLAERAQPPGILICASGINYYGSQGDQELNEDAAPGEDFLARVCRDWESACQPLYKCGTRIVNLRIAMVLSAEGGALKKMLLPFKLGLGGPIGDGSMYMSWITLEDLVRAINFCLNSTDISGPVNAASPNPVSNREFTKALSKALKRPAFLPAPRPMLKLVLGEMAEALLMPSIRAVPEKLLSAGFAFRHPRLDDALHTLLHRTK